MSIVEVPISYQVNTVFFVVFRCQGDRKVDPTLYAEAFQPPIVDRTDAVLTLVALFSMC